MLRVSRCSCSSPNLLIATNPPDKKPIAMRSRGFVRRAYTASAATVITGIEWKDTSSSSEGWEEGWKPQQGSQRSSTCRGAFLTNQAIVPSKVPSIVRDSACRDIEILGPGYTVNVEELVDRTQGR